MIGLWLAALSQRSWVTVALVACGLIAAVPFVWAAVAESFVGAPSWLLLVVFPFGIGGSRYRRPSSKSAVADIVSVNVPRLPNKPLEWTGYAGRSAPIR